MNTWRGEVKLTVDGVLQTVEAEIEYVEPTAMTQGEWSGWLYAPALALSMVPGEELSLEINGEPCRAFVTKVDIRTANPGGFPVRYADYILFTGTGPLPRLC